MLGHRDEIAWLQSDFYRNQFRKMLRWLIASLLIIYILIGAIVYSILFKPQVNFYANTSEGLILPMPPAKS